jgi:hypothetical protein
MKTKNHEWATHIYRLLLLSIMFGVLWVKEYLWCAFIMAMLLFLGDAFIIPMIRIATNLPPEYSAPRRSKTPKQPNPPPSSGEDDSGPEAGGSDDFREPMPGRTSPRRRGS